MASASRFYSARVILLEAAMSRRSCWIIFLVGLLGALAWCSSHIAALRLFQVDECQNIYMASVLAKGQAGEFFTNASLFLLGPLSWISRNSAHSCEVFEMARLVFLGVFWLNLCLIALIAGEKLTSLKTLVALVAAATLAPLWDYGFEVRHDNVVLAGVLLMWWAIRTKPMGLISYLIAGALSATLLFVAVKSVVYVMPLSLAILAFPPPTFSIPRWRLLASWFVGAAFATGIIRIAYGNTGGWQIYLSVFHGVARYSTGGGGGSPGFAPWTTLARLLSQTPLLLALSTGACVVAVIEAIRRPKQVLSWTGIFPEFWLFLGALAALAINPTPYPYNLVHVVPYAFLLTFRYLDRSWNELWVVSNARPVIVGILIFAHLVPFTLATRRHLNFLNWRQEKLMTLAEDLTAPLSDRVYDGIGMVPSRPTIHRQWYLHGLNIQSFLDGSGTSVRDMLAAKPAAVFIPNYRTDWLTDADHDFIKDRYVPLADDFWVLGKTLPAGGGTFEIYHPGRYRISTAKGSDLSATYALGVAGLMTPEDPGTMTGTLDGLPLTNRPVQLSVGVHRLECAPDCEPAVVWMGPHLDRVHRIGPGDHRALFINWY